MSQESRKVTHSIRWFLAVVGPWVPRLLLAVTAALLAVALWQVLHGAGGLP